MIVNGKPYRTVWMEGSTVRMINQLVLPYSFEIVDLPLVQRIAQTGKPMIVSTGMATLAEIDEAVEYAKNSPFPDPKIVYEDVYYEGGK